MTLEQQVCSKESSQRLRELGVPQESLFYYSRVNFSGKYELDFGVRGPWETVDTEHAISAFTVAELGEMLPADFWTQKAQEGGWKTKETISIHNSIAPMYFEDTEAEARAKMLIYLLENKLITLP